MVTQVKSLCSTSDSSLSGLSSMGCQLWDFPTVGYPSGGFLVCIYSWGFPFRGYLGCILVHQCLATHPSSGTFCPLWMHLVWWFFILHFRLPGQQPNTYLHYHIFEVMDSISKPSVRKLSRGFDPLLQLPALRGLHLHIVELCFC